MASETSLEDRGSAGRYYMNKIFGRGVERARALDRNGGNDGGNDGGSGSGGDNTKNPLGPVRRVTIEPQSEGGHRIVVERSEAAEDNGHPAASDSAGRNAPDSTIATEHSFGDAEHAIQFLSDVMNDREPAVSGGASEGDRFLDEILGANEAA